MRGAFPHHLLPDIPHHLSQSLGEATVNGIILRKLGTTDSSKVRIIQIIISSQGNEMNTGLINLNWLSWEHGIDISRWSDEEAVWDLRLGKSQAKGKDHKGTLSKWSSRVTRPWNTWSLWKCIFPDLLISLGVEPRDLHATQIITHILKFKKHVEKWGAKERISGLEL